MNKISSLKISKKISSKSNIYLFLLDECEIYMEIYKFMGHNYMFVFAGWDKGKFLVDVLFVSYVCAIFLREESCERVVWVRLEILEWKLNKILNFVL